MKCDVCGIEVTQATEGMAIKLERDHKEMDRVKKIFGKIEFHICLVCWLLSLGVKRQDG